MNATTKANLKAIFGSASYGTRSCRIIGHLKRPIPGTVDVYDYNLTDLWVWTAQPKRASQDVIARIDLSRADALDQLRAAGVRM